MADWRLSADRALLRPFPANSEDHQSGQRRPASGTCRIARAGAARRIVKGRLRRATVKIKFNRLTPRTIVDRRTLEDELERVAAQGYAWIDGELDPSICGIAVPLRDNSRSVVAAISVSLIAGTIDEATANER